MPKSSLHVLADLTPEQQQFILNCIPKEERGEGWRRDMKSVAEKIADAKKQADEQAKAAKETKDKEYFWEP